MLSESRREGRCGARWDELQRTYRHLGLVSLHMHQSWGLRALGGDGFTCFGMRSIHLRHELKALLGEDEAPSSSLCPSTSPAGLGQTKVKLSGSDSGGSFLGLPLDLLGGSSRAPSSAKEAEDLGPGLGSPERTILATQPLDQGAALCCVDPGQHKHPAFSFS